MVCVYGSFASPRTDNNASGRGAQTFQVQCGGQELDGLSGTGAGAERSFRGVRGRHQRQCLVPGATFEAKWTFIHEGLSRFAGRTLPLNDEVYVSASETNYRNQSIGRLLQSYGRIYIDPAEAVDLYTKQCALNVSARDLAVMGATLADGGVNPITKERVIDAAVCHYVLAVMTTAGLYETSGDWLFDIGLPGKSGIGGGIVTVSPGKGGLGTFAPPLDSAGNSVKEQLVSKFLSQQLGMDLFVSQPEINGRPIRDHRPGPSYN